MTTCDPSGQRHAGIAGHIAGYDVLIMGDTLAISHGVTGQQWRHTVPNSGTCVGDLAHRRGFRTSWGRFPDDVEVLSFYDRDHGNFGYAYKLRDPGLSEWGDATFSNDGAP